MSSRVPVLGNPLSRQPGDIGNPTAYRTTWTNPKPGSEIAMIGYNSQMTEACPILFAISVE